MKRKSNKYEKYDIKQCVNHIFSKSDSTKCDRETKLTWKDLKHEMICEWACF